MAFTKAHLFNLSDYHFSLISHALSHPARIIIIRKLLSDGKCRVKNLNQLVPLSKPTLSQHLRLLLSMNILQCEEEFPTVWYEINKDLEATIRIMEYLLFQDFMQNFKVNKSEIDWMEKFRNNDAKGNPREDTLLGIEGPAS